MDALHRKLFRYLLGGRWSHGVEAAIDITLLGRYYERYADHAVAVARRVVFLVTGEMPTPDAVRRESTVVAILNLACSASCVT